VVGKEMKMTEGKSAHSTGEWEVVVAKSYDRGDPASGAEESVLVRAAEDEARRVYADTVARAADMNYQYAKLRSNGHDVDTWPPATGWTV
jgi:hypothetical protein